MKTFQLILAAAAILSSGTFAQANDAPQTNGPDSFSRHKQAIQQALAARNAVLAQEQDCVAAATRPAELRACHVNAREAREQMGKELRAKLPGRGDGRDMGPGGDHDGPPKHGRGPRGQAEGSGPRYCARTPGSETPAGL